MTAQVIFGAVIGVLLLQTPAPPEDYPGQRDHAEPPKGWYCSAEAKDKAHKCSCKRMGQAVPEDPFCENQQPESPQCKVWCHADRCLCPIECKVPGHHH